MAAVFQSLLPTLPMRLAAHSTPSSFTTTTTKSTTSTTKPTRFTASTAGTASHQYPIPILITTAPQTPSPANTPQNPPTATVTTYNDTSSRLRKRLAPGLQARLRRLEEQNRQRDESNRRRHSIGRIPEHQLAELERLQREQREKQRSTSGAARTSSRTTAVAAHPPPTAMPVSGGVRLSGGPVWTDNEVSMPESGDDFSSVIDISEDLAGETTEDDEALYLDRHKYRLPSPGKTRLHLLTKEPLSPSPRAPVGIRPSSPPTPADASVPPTPPAKMDSAYASSHWRNGSVETVSDSDWTGTGASRAGSVYSLSRVSFAGQLSQLTSIRLPDADSLSKRILSMPSATEAARALSDAAEQIRMWISKASEVLSGLDADDDVEWAAAGGQEGIEDADDAIKRFERLVQVYVLSIERLQTRTDIVQLPPAELVGVVRQMDAIVASWQQIKNTLSGVKEQVTIAIEWMHLWNTVLGEIGQQMDALNALVFEMEEKRHQNAESLLTSRDSIAIDELETLVEDRQPGRMKVPGAAGSGTANRLSIPPFFPSSPVQAPVPDKEDSSLLALFARMQPLRASLDFLPMRLSTFNTRGGETFPTACQDLDQRRARLEAQWSKLEADADSLRRELGEDKWLTVFRNAGRQALKMCESVARSYGKLRDAVDLGEHHTNIPAITKKIENYEAKKTHYGPAIERVLAIIDRGVQDRLTVNGEILRLQSEMRQRWASLQTEMHDVDAMLDEFTQQTRDKELRDSVSTVVSSERSIGSSFVDTPGSSPASSVISHSRRNSLHGSRTPTALTNIKVRSGSTSTNKSAARLSSSSIPRRSLLPRASIGSDRLTSPMSSPASASTPSKSAPVWPSRPEPQLGNRPRWSATVKSDRRDFRSLSSQEPSPYSRNPVTPKATYLRSTPKPGVTTTPTTQQTHRNITSPSSLPRPANYNHNSPLQSRNPTMPASSSPAAMSSVYTPSKSLASRASNPILRPGSRLSSGAGASRKPAHAHNSQTLHAPRIFRDGNDADTEGGPSSSSLSRRPPSAMAHGPGKRSSSLFSTARARPRAEENTAAGASTLATIPAGSGETKPRWRV